MQIPTYQIHNVLNTYSSQLFKACLAEVGLPSEVGHLAEIQMAREVQRRALVDKIAVDIVQRITRLDSLTHSFSASESLPSSHDAALVRFDHFVFNTLDASNQKTAQTRSVEDSIFLIKRDTA